MTDFVLYIHGVNVRDPQYAAKLDKRMKRTLKKQCVSASVYWGDVSDGAEEKLLEQWKSSPIWGRMWFPHLREHMLLQLIGDGALYISRSFGAAIVQRIYDVVSTAFSMRQSGDRLHLVTHSWGAVILLDMLFANRWHEPNVPGREHVEQLRDALFGLGADKEAGILLASITTLGSPLSLFSLMDSDLGLHEQSSHDISVTMRKYCRALYHERDTALAWFNFVHPGDAFAYPTVPLLQAMLKEDFETVQPYDRLVKLGLPGRLLQEALGKRDASAITAAAAHNGYWDNTSVIASVVASIKETTKIPQQ